MTRMKSLKRGLAASLALATVFTGVGMSAPASHMAAANASTGTVVVTHEIRTPEAKSANRLLTNSTVRINARAQFDRAGSNSAVEFRLPKGLQAVDIPAHCGPNSTLSNKDEPSRTVASTSTSWQNMKEQVLRCDLGDTGNGYNNASVWIDAKVRPELPPNHKFTVPVQTVTNGAVVASASYTSLPTVYSKAEIAMGPHINLHPDLNWPTTNYLSSWRAQEPNPAYHPSPHSEAISYWRINYGMMLTTPSQYGNQPLDWSKSSIVFDMKPDEVYFPGVTQTKPWKDRQAKHGDAYQYYMPHLNISTTRPMANHTLSSGSELEAFRGASGDIKFVPNSSTQKITLDATQIDTSGWTVPVRSGAGDNEPLPNKASDYKGPDYEMLWMRNFEVYTPSQAIADLIPLSPKKDLLPVTIKQPTFKGVGLHEANKPWTAQSSWSKTGNGRAEGHVESRNYITAPWKSSPLNTPGIVFSPGFSSWWEGLPGSSSTGDGNGELMPGQTMMWSSSNRITAPPGGATAQFQCVTWENHLSLTDPKNKYNPGSGSSMQSERYPATGPVYLTGRADNELKTTKFQVQYSNTAPKAGGNATCSGGNWKNSPNDSTFNNNTAKASKGIYTGVRQVRFVVATDVPVRWDLMTVVPLTPTNDNYRGEAWVWNSYASHNYRAHTFDSLTDVNLTSFFNPSTFDEGDFDKLTFTNKTPLDHRAEKVTMVNPLSMIEMTAQTPIRGGTLGEVTVKPHSPSTSGPLEVKVNFDERMTYHATKKGPAPTQINANSVVYRISDPSSIEEIVIQMLTTPQQAQATGELSASSRLPGEASRRNNNATASMRIDSSTPMVASLRAEQDAVDVHPFTSPRQTNNWTMNFGNLTPYHTADITAYVLIPRAGMTSNTLSHAQADVILGSPSASGWTVRSSTSAFNRNSSVTQLGNATYTTLPSDRTNVEVVRLTRSITPGQEHEARLPMLATATSNGDKITPHLIYSVDLKARGEVVRSFTGVTSPNVTSVSAGSSSGIAWIDGTVADHDGVMQSSGRQVVPNVPVQIIGTTASGVNINKSVHSISTKTGTNGSWSLANLPAGDYKVRVASDAWIKSSDFTSFTKRGGASAVGYTGTWTKTFSQHLSDAPITINSVGSSNRTATANAGFIGDSAITVTREKSHDYGYRGQDYITSFKVTNNSDTFVENVEVYDRLDPTNAVGRSVARVTSGPGTVSNYGSSTTYTVPKLNPGQSATVQVTHKLSADKPEEGDKLPSTTTSGGFFYGYDSAVTEASAHSGEVAVPVISSDLSWTDSGSWLPSITDTRKGWQTGTNSASDAVLTEPREGVRVPDDRADQMFGPGESLRSTYTITNESEVVPISMRNILANLTGVELDEDVSFAARTLQPGQSVSLDANFVSKMAQIEVDRNDAEVDLDVSALAPRYKNNFSTETHNLDNEVTSAFDWDTWTVPFHRYSDLVLQGSARDASGDGVIEAEEEGRFAYTWLNKGNLTLSNPEFLDERTGQEPRFEGGFDGKLSPGEQVRGETAMPVGASLFSNGIFTNMAWSKASGPLSSDADPEARTTTMLTQRSESGLDLTIDLVDANGDGSVSIGEKFHYDLVLRNNSSEHYTDVKMSGPVKVTSGTRTYTLDVTFPSGFDGSLRPGETVSPESQSVTATKTTTAKGYVDLNSALLGAQARAVGVDTTGSSLSSNWATDTASVFAQPLAVAAGDGAGAGEGLVYDQVGSSSTLYWVLGVIAALTVLALIMLLTPARRIFVSAKRTEDKELTSV